MPYPVVSPPDRVIADLCLAADGLLDQHRSGEALEVPRTPGHPGGGLADRRHRASLVVPTAVASEAVLAGGLVIADAESVPVVELLELTSAATDDPAHTELSGVAAPATGVATGVGQHLRTSRAPLRLVGPRTVVVLGRPLLQDDLPQLAAHAQVVLAVPIAGPSPDGLPAAALLRLTERAASELQARGVTVVVVAVPLAWRDPRSDDLLAAAVADGLGGAVQLLLPATRSDGQWGRLLAWLDDTGRDTSTTSTAALDQPGGASPATAGLDAAVRAELVRWRPPRHRRGLVVFFTGLSGAGKSTIARALADHLTASGERTLTLLDGDEVRRLLSAGLGFDAEARHQNVTRIGYVAAEVARHGGVAICAPIAPYERSRAAARELVTHAGGDFVLVHVATTLADCEARDVKGLYARARAGEIAEFTGISDPYEIPEAAEVRIDTTGRSIEDSLGDVVAYLRAGGWISAPADDRTPGTE